MRRNANFYAKRRRTQEANRSTYSAQQPLPPIAAYVPNCQDIRQGDEYTCPPCGLRWACDEPRPTCLRDRR